jgi:hypothetical protein
MLSHSGFGLWPSLVCVSALFLGCSAQNSPPDDDEPTAGGSQNAGGSGAKGGKSAGGSSNSGGSSNTGGSSVGGSATSSGGSQSTGGSVSSGGSGGSVKPVGEIGAAEFASGELDAPSNGASITFQSIGAPGWYPSRRDPASNQCDAIKTATCCMTKHELTNNQLSPWNEELIVTLRGPMLVKQFVAYSLDSGSGQWNAVSVWDSRTKTAPQGVAFDGNETESKGFSGGIGTECLVDVSSSNVYPCGTGTNPFCPKPAGTTQKHYGWDGPKLFILLAAMPHVGSPLLSQAKACSTGTSGNWYDAPWIGFSHGELIRSGKFGDCHCYAKDPKNWALADGCGQFNAFEVVNDNNAYKNLDVFSTNLFAYHGYVGEGPCGSKCNVSALGADVDLIDKTTSTAALSGATASPSKGPGAAFRRPAAGYRYFVMLFDVATRTIQLATVHPQRIPPAAAAVLPKLPRTLAPSSVTSLVNMRLPK